MSKHQNNKRLDDDLTLGSRTASALTAILPPALLFWQKTGQQGPVEAVTAPLMAQKSRAYEPELIVSSSNDDQRTNNCQSETSNEHHHVPKLITEDRLRQPENRAYSELFLLPNFPAILRQFGKLHFLWKIPLALLVFFNPLVTLAVIFLVQVQVSFVRGAKAVAHSRFASLDFWGPVGRMVQHRWARFRRKGKVGRWTLVTIGILIDPQARRFALGYAKELQTMDEEQDSDLPHPQAGAVPKVRAFFANRIQH